MKECGVGAAPKAQEQEPRRMQGDGSGGQWHEGEHDEVVHWCRKFNCQPVAPVEQPKFERRISRDELELALNEWVEEYAMANGPTSRDDRRVALRAALHSLGIEVEE